MSEESVKVSKCQSINQKSEIRSQRSEVGFPSSVFCPLSSVLYGLWTVDYGP